MTKETRTVLVTGGARGIGAETVRRFCREGYRVAFTYISSFEAAERLARESGAFAIKADSAIESEVQAAVSLAEEHFGSGIEILVNNAGISASGLLSELSYEEWNRIFAVNVGGAFLYSRAVLPAMIRNHAGCIINISSIWGMVGASCEVAYSASKAALLGFTKALAKELGPSDIRVNAVAPGVVDTDMMREYDEAAKAALREETPLCRLGRPEEIADAVFFLAGKGAGFITGQVLSPNGGFTVI